MCIYFNCLVILGCLVFLIIFFFNSLLIRVDFFILGKLIIIVCIGWGNILRLCCLRLIVWLVFCIVLVKFFILLFNWVLVK